MRRKRPLPNQIGLAMVIIGVLIILALILPSGFWWFALGIGLIAAGVCCCKKF